MDKVLWFILGFVLGWISLIFILSAYLAGLKKRDENDE